MKLILRSTGFPTCVWRTSLARSLCNMNDWRILHDLAPEPSLASDASAGFVGLRAIVEQREQARPAAAHADGPADEAFDVRAQLAEFRPHRERRGLQVVRQSLHQLDGGQARPLFELWFVLHICAP